MGLSEAEDESDGTNSSSSQDQMALDQKEASQERSGKSAADQIWPTVSIIFASKDVQCTVCSALFLVMDHNIQKNWKKKKKTSKSTWLKTNHDMSVKSTCQRNLWICVACNTFLFGNVCRPRFSSSFGFCRDAKWPLPSTRTVHLDVFYRRYGDVYMVIVTKLLISMYQLRFLSLLLVECLDTITFFKSLKNTNQWRVISPGLLSNLRSQDISKSKCGVCFIFWAPAPKIMYLGLPLLLWAHDSEKRNPIWILQQNRGLPLIPCCYPCWIDINWPEYQSKKETQRFVEEATMADLRRSVEKALGMPPSLGWKRQNFQMFGDVWNQI